MPNRRAARPGRRVRNTTSFRRAWGPKPEIHCAVWQPGGWSQASPEQMVSLKAPHLGREDGAGRISGMPTAGKNSCEGWDDWSTYACCREENCNQERLQIRVSENFMTLCYSNSKS